MRKPKFENIYYEKTEQALNRQLEECFTSKLGPGALPGETNGKTKAILVPHENLKIAGPNMAWAYKLLAETNIPDLYIVIGPSHSKKGAGISLNSFQTEYGIIRTDQDFANELLNKKSIDVNEEIHEDEYSIELQLPFLQFVKNKDIEKLRILQIIVDENTDLKKLSLDIKETLMDQNKNAFFIFTSNLTYYGRNYRHVPFTGPETMQLLRNLDEEVIDLIKNTDVNGFLDYIKKNLSSICGKSVIFLMMQLFKDQKIELVSYYNSSEITNDEKNNIGFASFSIE